MTTISITTNSEIQGAKRSSKVQKCQEELVANQIYTLHGNHRGSQILALKGSIWITQQGDPVDYLIKQGESIRLDRKGKVVIQGLAKENCFAML